MPQMSNPQPQLLKPCLLCNPHVHDCFPIALFSDSQGTEDLDGTRDSAFWHTNLPVVALAGALSDPASTFSSGMGILRWGVEGFLGGCSVQLGFQVAVSIWAGPVAVSAFRWYQPSQRPLRGQQSLHSLSNHSPGRKQRGQNNAVATKHTTMLHTITAHTHTQTTTSDHKAQTCHCMCNFNAWKQRCFRYFVFWHSLGPK